MRLLLHLVAAFTLLVGQAHALVHKADLDAHKDGHACEFCLHSSSLKDTACSGLPPAAPPVAASFDVAPERAHVPSFRALETRARSPPASLFVI